MNRKFTLFQSFGMKFAEKVVLRFYSSTLTNFV